MSAPLTIQRITDSYRKISNDIVLKRFAEHINEVLDFLDNLDPHKDKPLQPYLSRANAFLRKHAGINYETLLRRIDYSELHGDDYDLILKRGLKKRLFNYRSMAYLAALYLCEQEGVDTKELLRKARDITIPPIKKSVVEPTLEVILKFIN